MSTQEAMKMVERRAMKKVRWFVWVICLSIMLLVTLIGCTGFEGDYSNHRRYLHSLKDNQAPNGSFFLGCGLIKGEQYYAYYYKDGQGGIRFAKTDRYTDTVIYEDEEERPYVDLHIWNANGEIQGAKFHIPKDSISNDFELDAE